MVGQDCLTKEEVRDVYDKQAGIYDLAVWFYYLVGMRIGRWRRMAVNALSLQAGDTVVEIGCGTGLNFSLLEKAVGSEGKIIGVDISEQMLEKARNRVRAAGWQNVELVRYAASEFNFPDDTRGILATGVLTYVPEFDKVLSSAALGRSHVEGSGPYSITKCQAIGCVILPLCSAHWEAASGYRGP